MGDSYLDLGGYNESSKAERPLVAIRPFSLKENAAMATEKQLEANRRNAQKSTGPSTEAGRAKAKFNALKHGMTADTAVLPYEDSASYEQLREALIDNYEPVGAGEQMLVELVAVNYWRLLRARRVEQASMKLHIEALKDRNGLSTEPTMEDDGGLATAFAGPHDTFRKLERYQTNVERSYYRAVETLRKAQNDRKREEYRQAPAHKIGFVSKTMASKTEASKTMAAGAVRQQPDPDQTAPQEGNVAIDQPSQPGIGVFLSPNSLMVLHQPGSYQEPRP